MPGGGLQIIRQNMLRRRLVQAENELHARVGTPTIQVLGLTEVGVATQQHFAKTTLQTNTQSAIYFRGRAFVRGPIAGTVEQAQNLAGVGQRHDER